MHTRVKILLWSLSLGMVAILIVAGAYQRHLRFLMTDFSGAAQPAKEVAFPSPGVSPLEDALLIDGVRLPFREEEITRIRSISDFPATEITIRTGIKVTLHVATQASNRERLYEQFALETASRNQFHWSMTASEVQQLDDRIRTRGSLLDVSHVALRKTPSSIGLLKVYPALKMNEWEWFTTKGNWNGIFRAQFTDAPGYNTDMDKQIAFMAQLVIEREPTGRFEEELTELLERVRAKDPSAVVEVSVTK